MSEFDNISASALHHSPAREAVSAVRLSEQLTAKVDAWAVAHGLVRSDAIRRLLELGLCASAAVQHQSASLGSASLGRAERDSAAIEALAISQINHLLDPLLAPGERERRIRRLTEGPPEFTDLRIDRPKPRQ